jgi:hypothetical protein
MAHSTSAGTEASADRGSVRVDQEQGAAATCRIGETRRRSAPVPGVTSAINLDHDDLARRLTSVRLPEILLRHPGDEREF